MQIIATAETLASFISYLSPLVDESRFHFEEEGLRARAVDPANVAMVQTTLAASAFDTFEGDATIGVNLGRLDDYISMADSDQLVTITLEEETRKLQIEYGGFSSTMALIDPSSIRDEPDIPDLDLPAEIVMTGEQLSRGVDAADMVSDHITFGVDPADESTFYVDAEGDIDDVSIQLSTDDLIDLTTGTAESIYSLDYLELQTKPIDDDTEVRMELGEEFPMKLHLRYADGAGHVTYMTAPRIKSD